MQDSKTQKTNLTDRNITDCLTLPAVQPPCIINKIEAANDTRGNYRQYTVYFSAFWYFSLNQSGTKTGVLARLKINHPKPATHTVKIETCAKTQSVIVSSSYLNIEPQIPEVYVPQVSVTMAFLGHLATGGHLQKPIAKTMKYTRQRRTGLFSNPFRSRTGCVIGSLHSALMAAVLTGR